MTFGKHQICTCKLCGVQWRTATERRYCPSCRRLKWRINEKLAEATKRSNENGKKID
jgi:hypothetical protein